MIFLYLINNKKNKNTFMKTKRINDKVLLESLIRKYGANAINNAINEMEENLEPITVTVDYVPDDSMQVRKDIICFRKNGIKAVYDDDVVWDNMEFTAISEKSKYALTDYILNYYNQGDIVMIEEYWPELLPYVDGCEGAFINYDNWL